MLVKLLVTAHITVKLHFRAKVALESPASYYKSQPNRPKLFVLQNYSLKLPKYVEILPVDACIYTVLKHKEALGLLRYLLQIQRLFMQTFHSNKVQILCKTPLNTTSLHRPPSERKLKVNQAFVSFPFVGFCSVKTSFP